MFNGFIFSPQICKLFPSFVFDIYITRLTILCQFHFKLFLTLLFFSSSFYSYNRYLAIAARTVRNALKEDKRIAAERRNLFETRSAKWENGKQEEYSPVKFLETK